MNGSDQAEVIITFKPTALTFRPNKSVMGWVPMSSIPGIFITEGATVDWDSKQVLVQFRVSVRNCEEDPTPVLMLEALILDSGAWEGMPLTMRKTMSGNRSSAILLWSEPCQWYSPLPEYKLPTAPGILRLNLDISPPTEFTYRLLTQIV